MPLFGKKKSWKVIRGERLAKYPVPSDLRLTLENTVRLEKWELWEAEKNPQNKRRWEEAVTAMYIRFDTFLNDQILATLPTENLRQNILI